MDAYFRELETLFLPLGDKTRLKLLGLMADGPVAVGLLAEKLGESQPKISRHLAYLRNAGVVSTERDGKYIYYCIESAEDERVNDVLGAVIESLTGGVPIRGRRRSVRASERPVEPVVLPADTYTEEETEEEYAEDGSIDVYEHAGQPESPEREELDIFLL